MSKKMLFIGKLNWKVDYYTIFTSSYEKKLQIQEGSKRKIIDVIFLDDLYS